MRHRLPKFIRTWIINGPDWVVSLLVWWYGPSRPQRRWLDRRFG